MPCIYHHTFLQPSKPPDQATLAPAGRAWSQNWRTRSSWRRPWTGSRRSCWWWTPRGPTPRTGRCSRPTRCRCSLVNRSQPMRPCLELATRCMRDDAQLSPAAPPLLIVWRAGLQLGCQARAVVTGLHEGQGRCGSNSGCGTSHWPSALGAALIATVVPE